MPNSSAVRLTQGNMQRGSSGEGTSSILRHLHLFNIWDEVRSSAMRLSLETIKLAAPMSDCFGSPETVTECQGQAATELTGLSRGSRRLAEHRCHESSAIMERAHDQVSHQE
jgi:hypothetical protein